MVYANYEFYSETYKGNSIPETDFGRLILRASVYLDTMSCDTVKTVSETEAVKMAACAVAEAWLINEQGGDVVSQSVGSWSKSFQRKVKSDDERLYEAAKMYLGSLVKKVRWI